MEWVIKERVLSNGRARLLSPISAIIKSVNACLLGLIGTIKASFKALGWC